MIEIRHKETGEVLHRVEADTLVGAELVSAMLDGANLAGVNLTNANLREAKLNNAILGGAILREVNLRDAELRGVNLRGANLTRAELRGAILGNMGLLSTDLTGADLEGVNLLGADLQGTSLIYADLGGAMLAVANLTGADLRGASLINTDLMGTKLEGANLTGASLRGARLDRPRLKGAKLTDAILNETLFINCSGLHEAVGLTEVQHNGPSSLDNRTLRASVDHLPDVFLQGVGYTNREIEYLRTLYNEAVPYFSCFLSHAGEDHVFADRLRRDLVANNVSCWHYRYDMRGGQFWRTQINEAVKLHDKLVLICSEQSLVNRNVVDEIVAAIERERETGSQKLFPIRLDDFILGDKMLALADRKMKAQEWREDWVRYVSAYHIPDFSTWKDHDAYRAEFDKLLRDLKEPAQRPKGSTKRKARANA